MKKTIDGTLWLFFQTILIFLEITILYKVNGDIMTIIIPNYFFMTIFVFLGLVFMNNYIIEFIYNRVN